MTEGEGSSLSTSTPWKRPLGLVVFIGIWCAVAVYNFYIADAMFGPEAALAGGSVGPASTYSLLVQDLTLRIFLQVISVVQLGVAYWLWRGSSFSYIAGLGISALDLLTVGSLFVLYYLAPKGDQLRTPFLYENMALILAFTGLTWLYLSRPKVRRYLTRWA
ncbi:MAG TPA: hypothetical protein VKF15_00760 [Nitrososphaerales archaeon]|nr:hypothetical protein [Nitrososphaerales archaeon]